MTTQVVADLRQQLAKELDFRLEADNSRALAAATADDPGIAVPAVHDALSNERVMTMDWVQGAKVGLNLICIHDRAWRLRGQSENSLLPAFAVPAHRSADVLVLRRRPPGADQWA